MQKTYKNENFLLVTKPSQPSFAWHPEGFFMDHHRINRGSPENAIPPNPEIDGGCIPTRENFAQVFFRRAGRFFSEMADAVAGAFRGLAQSVRHAFAHVERVFSGGHSNTAVTHVRQYRIPEQVDLFTDDDDSMADVDVNPPSSQLVDESPVQSVDQENSDAPDFFGMANSSERSTGKEDFVSSDKPADFEEKHEKFEQTGIVSRDKVVDTSSPEAQEMSNGEKIFDEFSKRYDPNKGYLSIAHDDSALDPSCLQFAKKFQQEHPENANIKYKKEVQEKRKAATALLSLHSEMNARAAEKSRLEQESMEKIAEQHRRQALSPGQADFEDFLAAFQTAQKSGREYLFAEESKFFEDTCLEYARQRSTQQPEHGERLAIEALLSAAGKATERMAKTSDGVPASTSAPPPPSPLPRWKSALQNLLGISEEIPAAHQDVWMVHYQPDQKNKAWEGLRLLLSPRKSDSSSSSVLEVEGVLSYQTGTAVRDEYQLERLELAMHLLNEMLNFDINSHLKNTDFVKKTDDQKNIITDNLKRITNVGTLLRSELQSRIDALLPRKNAVIADSQSTEIPEIKDLKDSVFSRASDDFNRFAEDFYRSTRTGAYAFNADRQKYLRSACVAIAKSVVDTYQHADNLTDSDQHRLTAALFLVNQYRLGMKSSTGERSVARTEVSVSSA